jgi:hypothetical protein
MVGAAMRGAPAAPEDAPSRACTCVAKAPSMETEMNLFPGPPRRADDEPRTGRSPRRRALAVLLAGATALVALAVTTAPAGATGPGYPGETLSLALRSPAVVGKATIITASGTNADDDPGGFNLNLWAKDPRVDSTCAPSYIGEENTSVTETTDLQVVIGLAENLTPGPFRLPFKLTFARPGPVLLCGYSTWVTDTAAAAQLRVNVGSGKPVAPPDTRITGFKRNAAKRTVRFAFAGARAVGALRFACKLDKGAFKRCRSPQTYKHLRKGRHTFAVRARDSRGKLDPTAAKKRFRI